MRQRRRGPMVVLLVAGTAVGVWLTVEKVFVDRWERQELANQAARGGGPPPGPGDPTQSGPTARGQGGRSGTDGV